MWPNYELKWDRVAIEAVAHAIATDIVRGLRQQEFRTQPLPIWSESRNALDRLFGKLGSTHFLGVPSINWGVVLTEPQITQGWRYFLDPTVCGDQIGRHRCAAFLAALAKGSGAVCWAVAPEDLLELRVAAEVQTQRIGKSRYIDLLLTWVSGDGDRKGAAIEFKFGHQLSQYQLSDYRRSLRQTFQPEHLNLYVVAATARPRDARSVRLNRSWRFTTWYSLLRSLGILMPDGFDDNDFRQFRSTVWTRAGQ